VRQPSYDKGTPQGYEKFPFYDYDSALVVFNKLVATAGDTLVNKNPFPASYVYLTNLNSARRMVWRSKEALEYEGPL
jgi:hypothetical protein